MRAGLPGASKQSMWLDCEVAGKVRKRGWGSNVKQKKPRNSRGEEGEDRLGTWPRPGVPHSLQRSLQARDRHSCHNFTKAWGRCGELCARVLTALVVGGIRSEPAFPPSRKQCKQRREDRAGQGQGALSAPVRGAAVWPGSFQALGHNADCDRVRPCEEKLGRRKEPTSLKTRKDMIWPVDTVSFLQ